MAAVVDFDPRRSGPSGPASLAASVASPNQMPHHASPAPALPTHGILIEDATPLEIEFAALDEAVRSVAPETARDVTCQNWRKCVIGDDKSESFLIRAILKSCSDRVIRDVVNTSLARIFKIGGDDLLDRAMEIRLESVPALQLVKMLARAKRLGYDENDIVDENEDVMPMEEDYEGAESDVQEVAPPMPPMQPLPPMQTLPPMRHPLPEHAMDNAQHMTVASAGFLPSQAMSYSVPPEDRTGQKPKIYGSTKFMCQACGQSFTQSAGLKYHVEKKVCHKNRQQQVTKPLVLWCDHCGKGFTNQGGFNYHKSYKVCKSHDMAMATPPVPSSQPQPLQEQAPFQPAPRLGDPALQTQVYNAPTSLETFQPTPAKINLPRPNAPMPPSTPDTYSTSPGMDREASNPAAPSPMVMAELNMKLAEEVEQFERTLREMPEDMTAAAREEAVRKLKNSHATRKSILRRKYGVQVRTSKHKKANAENTPDGNGVAGPFLGSAAGTPPASSPAFLPVNRLDTYRATPPSTAQSQPPYQPYSSTYKRDSPQFSGPDAKRRRVSNLPPPGPELARRDSAGSNWREEGQRRYSMERQPSVMSGVQQGRDSHSEGYTGVEVDPAVTARAAEIRERNRVEQGSNSPTTQPRALSNSPSDTSRAAAQLPLRRVPVGEAQRKWDMLNPINRTSDTPTPPSNPAPPPARTPLPQAREPVQPTSDSGSDSNDDIPSKKPSPIAAKRRGRPPSNASASTSPAKTMPRATDVIRATAKV